MAVYSYCCPKCQGKLELFRPMKDRDYRPMCVEPGCDGQVMMERELAAPSIQLKGSGWTPKFHDR